MLEVKNLCHPTEFAHISFSLRKGKSSALRAGGCRAYRIDAGAFRRHAAIVRGNYPQRTAPALPPACGCDQSRYCLRAGRKAETGAIIALPIAQNISLPQLSTLNPNGVLHDDREWKLANEYAKRLQVKAFSWKQAVETLSGGNQQKVVIGKWLATHPDVIILDEPTKGIDIGSKAAVHQFMSELVSQGLAVIMVSSELPEVMGMADRIIVMHEGLMVAEYRAGDATAETIVSAASGAKQEAA